MPVQSGEFDVQMMRRAIRLAMNGRGRVEPNPMVGCVIVSPDGRVIGEGFHEHYGGPHAEPNALAGCTESPAGATAYVTLEPCCHANKKTPPCTPQLIEAKIARVVAGCVDPNPEVNGNGLDMLRAAGIEVATNVLPDEAKQLLAPFIARVVYGRPYVTLKWAETADGKVAGAGGRRLQISNAASSRVVHALRGRSDAILVGVNTVIVDDPTLTPRPPYLSAPPPRMPTRVVLDSDLRTPATSRLVKSASPDAPVTVFCSVDAYDRPSSGPLAFRGVHVIPLGRTAIGRVSLAMVLERLAARGQPGATHVLVEPGPTLARSFIRQSELLDRIWVIRSPRRIDQPSAPAGVGVPPDFVAAGEIEMDGDRLTEYLNPGSPVFFAPASSADLVLSGVSV